MGFKSRISRTDNASPNSDTAGQAAQAAQKGQDLMPCPKCGTAMRVAGREHVMAELDDDDWTDGQLADYMAAELSGEFGDWGQTEITYICGNCSHSMVVIED
jgi:predicted RNA-binding Zn-ribbon protein involved in translation (DUF1610 family)